MVIQISGREKLGATINFASCLTFYDHRVRNISVKFIACLLGMTKARASGFQAYLFCDLAQAGETPFSTEFLLSKCLNCKNIRLYLSYCHRFNLIYLGCFQVSNFKAMTSVFEIFSEKEL